MYYLSAKTTIQETAEALDNGYKEICVNAEVDDGSDISELMRYFVGKENNLERTKQLFLKTVELKGWYTNTEEGINTMSDIIEQLVKEETEKALEERNREMVQVLKRRNVDISVIKEATGWSEEAIRTCPA